MMRFRAFRMWLPLLVAVALAGCAAPPQPLTFTPESFPSGKYLAKAENFQILLDASQTMANKGGTSFATAKGFVTAVNASLPADYVANAGLRSFGHSEKQSKNLTDLVYGQAKYARDDMKAGVDKVKFAGGDSPLGVAIKAAGADFEKATGNITLVIVSDGIEYNMDDALSAAKAIKAKYGDRICIYTVWVGDDLNGKQRLENVAKAGGCGFAETSQALTDPKAFSAWVEKVFLVKKPEPPPVAAPAPPPPPAPPAPCKGIVTANLTFDLDKATIKPEMVPVLQEVKKIIDECRTATYKVAGHTCNLGTDAYNQKLSERRAEAIKKWLVDNGVAASRLETVGFGESKPKYDNGKDEGRKMNRRVEFLNK